MTFFFGLCLFSFPSSPPNCSLLHERSPLSGLGFFFLPYGNVWDFPVMIPVVPVASQITSPTPGPPEW